jgi:hypothetical protein
LYRPPGTAIHLVLATLLIVPIPTSARILAAAAPLCQAVEKLPDGSWTTKVPVRFGKTASVDAGVILYEGTVINGLDLGAVLGRDCGRWVRRPLYYCYAWSYCVDADHWEPRGFPFFD